MKASTREKLRDAAINRHRAPRGERRYTHDVPNICAKCSGLGWQMRKNPADGAEPCKACKGHPRQYVNAVPLLARLAGVSMSTARRVLYGERVTVETIGRLVEAGERYPEALP